MNNTTMNMLCKPFLAATVIALAALSSGCAGSSPGMRTQIASDMTTAEAPRADVCRVVTYPTHKANVMRRIRIC